VLIFTRTKHGANRLAKQLEQDGIRSAAIHGNKSQSARTAALADFKNYRVQALVATEVAARGLDIKELPHVVNYELPNVPEDYVHRIGRTGRAGSTGVAVSLVAHDERDLLRDIERLLRKTITQQPLPTFAPAPPPLREHEERYQDPRAQRSNGNRPQRGRSNAPRSGNSSQPQGQRSGQGQSNGNRAPQGRHAQSRQGQSSSNPNGNQQRRFS
jgi:ATP-dependent RNA helicase RhlE